MLDYNAIPTAISLYSLEIYVELETKKGLGRLVVEVSSSHTHTHTRTRARTHTHKHTHTHTHMAGLIWMSDQLLAMAATYTR